MGYYATPIMEMMMMMIIIIIIIIITTIFFLSLLIFIRCIYSFTGCLIKLTIITIAIL